MFWVGCEVGEMTSGACGDSLCDEPPADGCDGQAIVTFKAADSCDGSGECVYVEASRQACSGDTPYCYQGSCTDIDPCADITCGPSNAPSPSCDGDKVIAFDGTSGVCVSGVCEYETLEAQTCSGDTPICLDGACLGEDLEPCPNDAFADLSTPDVSGTYFVAPDGDDANAGTSRDQPFATLQAGVDALEPGDTLIVAPGEYYGAVRREGIGGAGVKTTIRAQIPGTAIVRGDIAAPPFRPLAGYDFVYVADLDFDEEITMVNELDTLSGIQRVPGIPEVEFSPGTFFQDEEAGKLYVSSSDGASVLDHHYSLSIIPTHGFYFRNAQGLVIDGMVVTGFNQARLIHNREQTLLSVWGIALVDARDSVVRNTHVYLNARGIA
ncbi:MAG: hypothetical protein ACNA8W_09490, partial [Bradymonadaceae bacterium]